MHRETKRRTYILLLFCLSYLTQYCFNTILARNMSAGDYGQISIILKVADILVPIVLLGFDSSLAKLLPPMIVKDKSREIKQFFSAFIHMMYSRLFLVFFTACTGCFFIYIHNTTILELNNVHYPLVLLCFLVPLLSTTVIFNKLLAIYKKYFLAVFIFDVLKFVIATILLNIAFFRIKTANFFHIFEVLLLSYFLVALLQGLYVVPIIKENIRGVKKAVLEKSWLNLSIGYMLNTLVHLIFSSINLFVLSILSSSESVGQFNALIVISSILFLVSCASATSVIPQISEFYQGKQYKKLQSLLTESFTFDFASLLIVALGLVIFSSTLLTLFGKDYENLNLQLYAMIFTMFFVSCNANIARLLVYTKYHKETLMINIIGIFLIIILDIILIPRFTLWGAIFSFLSVNITQTILRFILVKRKLPVKPFVFI